MSRLPKIAIVGRPNVGKSALFNRIIRKRCAIVDSAEGVTRDRLYGEAELFGFPFEVIDTGGIHPKSKADFNNEILRQAEIAVEEADSLIMVVDATVGLTALDRDVAKILRRSKKPMTLAINKVDNPNREILMHDFHPLGIKEMVAVSASQNWHLAELLEVALEGFEKPEEPEDDGSLKVAIIGRPNVGKSTLVNSLLKEERCVVSPIAGTTRDSVDIPFSWEETPYTLVDTAGIRRKKSEHDVVDKFAAIRTERAIERSDICLLMLDAQDGLTTQEKRIATMIEKSGKACILLFNKWDLVKGFRMEHCMKSLRDEASFLSYCPAIFLSAVTGRNIEKIFEAIEEVRQELNRRVTTGALNKFMEESLQNYHPPMITGKRLRVYYLTQIGTAPPELVLFVNKPDLMTDSYKRYLYNRLRETFKFTGVPIRFFLRGKIQSKGRREKALLEK